MKTHTIKTVEDTVLSFYLSYQDSLSVPEIRTQCRLSDTIIRKALRESNRLAMTHKDVKIMSKSAPGCVHQFRSVSAFHPTREWLAELVKKDRKELHYIKTERKWNG